MIALYAAATQMIIIGLITATSILAPACPALAQSSSVNEIIRSLAPIDHDRRSREEYSRLVPYTTSQGHRSAVIVDSRYAVDLTIFFRYNSADLTDIARQQLKPLGLALQSAQLSRYRYMLAGHTDSVGSDEFNRDLSSRRAAAVAHHLGERYGIAPHRLVVVGFGASQLKLPRDPRAAANRRVEVVLIDDRPAPSASPQPYPAGTDCSPDGMRGGRGPLDDFKGCDNLPKQPSRIIINQ
jgi:outer membrane protein OmpA-like peptidoglycan-associated protein